MVSLRLNRLRGQVLLPYVQYSTGTYLLYRINLLYSMYSVYKFNTITTE